MWAPDGHVSWLEAALTRLPGTQGSQWQFELAFRELPGPLTVAGPRRTCTGFRKPLRPNHVAIRRCAGRPRRSTLEKYAQDVIDTVLKAWVDLAPLVDDDAPFMGAGSSTTG